MNETEKRVTDTILEKGVVVRAGRFNFKLRQPYAGTLFEVSKVACELGFDEGKFSENPLGEIWHVTRENSRGLSRIIAIVILRDRLRIMLFKGLLSRYLLWHLTPSRLKEITEGLITACNMVDFLTSIRSIAGVRITTPREDLNPVDQGG